MADDEITPVQRHEVHAQAASSVAQTDLDEISPVYTQPVHAQAAASTPQTDDEDLPPVFAQPATSSSSMPQSEDDFDLRGDRDFSDSSDSLGDQSDFGDDDPATINITLRSTNYGDDSSNDGDNANESQNFTTDPSRKSNKKRKYRYINRRKAVKDQSNMRKKWKSNVLSVQELRSLECCKKKCFSGLNCVALSEKVKYAISITYSERRDMLRNMLTSNGRFCYDGNIVCSSFLLKAFNFSRDLQSSVKRAPNQFVDKCVYNRSASMRESIIDIINRLTELTADKMPDKSQVHLPFTRKKDVFMHIISEYHALYGTSSSPPSNGYISSIWRSHCPHVKVRKKSRFTICSTCDEINTSLENALKNRSDTMNILTRKRDHMDYVNRERLEYRRKRNNAIREPSKYCSLIMDGADQSAYGLPHFTTTTKDVKGQSMKVRLIGVLQHASTNTLRLYTMTEEHKTGANHIIESLHRALNDMAMTNSLSQCLYIQADNCFRENKNRYLFAYAESMVAWKLFDEVEVAFLPKGHTHEDIDQSFSTTSKALAHENAVTLQDMHEVLRKVYNKNTQVSHIKHIINWSQLCEDSGCLRNINNFTNYQYFKFIGRNPKTSEQRSVSKIRIPKNVNQNRLTACFVRHNQNDEWKELIEGGPSKGHGFLKFPPDLAHTPPLQIAELGGIEEINKRISSEEQRINSTCKMRQLFELRDYVYRQRTERLHWNLKRCVELKGRGYSGVSKERELEPSTTQKEKENVTFLSDRVVNDFEYSVGDLVATFIEDDHGCPFWIAKVVKIIRNRDGIVSNLKVHWLELFDSRNVFTGKYRPASRVTKKRTEVEWMDNISSDSVLITFSDLTKTQHLPMSVQKHLRQITHNPDVS